MRVALLLVALVAAAHATCLADKLGVYFSNSGTGSLSGVNPTTVQNLPSLPICASAYTKTADGFSTCCNVDGFNAIKTFGDNIAASIDQIIATGESLKNVFANIDTTKIPDQYKEAFNTFKSVFGDFLKNFFGNYGTCVRAYADYYEGVLCSLCRPDFFPTVANITDAGVLQFRFDLGTCTSIVNKCTPAVQDLYTFVTKLAAAYALLTPNLGSLVPGVTVPSTNVDLDFLAGIAGSTTAEKIRIWLCNQRMAGISQIDLVELSESVSAISQFTLPVKREAGMIRLREWAGKLAQRQVTPAGSQTNTYNDSGYPAYSVGTNQNFIQTAAASSFVASAVLVAAGVAVMLF